MQGEEHLGPSAFWSSLSSAEGGWDQDLLLASAHGASPPSLRLAGCPQAFLAQVPPALTGEVQPPSRLPSLAPERAPGPRGARGRGARRRPGPGAPRPVSGAGVGRGGRLSCLSRDTAARTVLEEEGRGRREGGGRRSSADRESVGWDLRT
ncbi:unnamed protein product [Lepidochelys olivacea]